MIQSCEVVLIVVGYLWVVVAFWIVAGVALEIFSDLLDRHYRK